MFEQMLKIISLLFKWQIRIKLLKLPCGTVTTIISTAETPPENSASRFRALIM